MIDRSNLFKTAWHKARVLSATTGRKLRAVFPEALRAAWASLRDPRSIESVMAREFASIIAGIRAEKAAGTLRIGPSRWSYANAGV